MANYTNIDENNHEPNDPYFVSWRSVAQITGL